MSGSKTIVQVAVRLIDQKLAVDGDVVIIDGELCLVIPSLASNMGRKLLEVISH